MAEQERMDRQAPGRLALRGSLFAGLIAFALDRGHKLIQLELLGWRDACPPPGSSVCPFHPVLPCSTTFWCGTPEYLTDCYAVCRWQACWR